MKRISFLLLFSFIGLLATAQKSGELNGTWIPVKQELGGDAFPNETFEGQKLVINGDSYTLHAESVDKGKLSYSKGKMTIEGTEGANSGKTIPAIYKVEDGMLVICYNLGGTDNPKGFSTKGEPMYFMATFRKE